MRELKQAYLMAPVKTNDGMPLIALHGDLYNLLSETFGGFTVMLACGVGTLRSGERRGDEIAVYAIAMEPSSANSNKLREIARYIRQEADQESVYIVLADGQVEFITEGDTEA